RSVFVREDAPPSASVMIRMARGRQLSESQVSAMANLVAASVPGLAIEAVRIVDQHGRLLSQPSSQNSDRLELQSRMESKLRAQIAQLLTPMLGAGNFSSEIQVRSRQLSESQVSAVANLVAASVPGLAIEAVRIVDQHGRLLSQPSSQNSDRLELQSRMESKLRAQIAQLLTPMLGEGNFSSEIQV